MRPILSLLLVLPVAAQAGGPMSADAFDAATRGKTILYGSAGQAYGAEEYLDDRRVRWSFLDGDCLEGRWYDDGARICFVYEDFPSPQCWLFHEGGGEMTAEFVDDGQVTGPLIALSASDEPLYCKGPKVGV